MIRRLLYKINLHLKNLIEKDNFSKKMKIFPTILIFKIDANYRADDSIEELIEIRERAHKLVDGPRKWHRNMLKNIQSITDAMIRIVTRTRIVMLFLMNKKFIHKFTFLSFETCI